MAVGPADGKLYISDPEKHQVFRAIEYYNIADVKNNIEAVVGSGGKCLPGDKMLCGDGRKARDAKLAYPKGNTSLNITLLIFCVFKIFIFIYFQHI